MLVLFSLTLPLLVLAYVPSTGLAVALTVITVATYWTVNEVARDVEDPFLYGECFFRGGLRGGPWGLVLQGLGTGFLEVSEVARDVEDSEGGGLLGLQSVEVGFGW